MAIGFSQRLFLYLLAVHIATIEVVWLTAVPVPIRIIVTLPIILNLVYFLFRDVLAVLPNSWRHIDLVPGGFRITIRNGTSFSCADAGKIFVSPYFVVLRVRTGDGVRSFARVIFPDSLSTGRYRELCVSLKHG
jgi:hypothetical protein